MKITHITCIAALAAGSTLAPAAVITWGSATNVSSVSEVSNVGTTVEAFNAAATSISATLSLNGVSFTSTGALLNNNTTNDQFTGDTGNADYNQFLSQIDFGGGTNLVSLTIASGLLTDGDDYLIQVWYANSSGTRTTPFGDGETPNNTVDLVASTTSAQFAIGTFTAVGTSQTLTLESPGFGNAHITGYQVRAVPEPSSAALLGLGGLALILRRRK